MLSRAADLDHMNTRNRPIYTEGATQNTNIEEQKLHIEYIR